LNEQTNPPSYWSKKLKELEERNRVSCDERGDFTPEKVDALKKNIIGWEDEVLKPALEDSS